MPPMKKITAKRQVWNKGLEVGKRDGFTPAQVKQIRSVLGDRGVAGVRDLALFSTAIDTMLHGHNLLTLVVGDVQSRNGSIRPLIEVAQSKGASWRDIFSNAAMHRRWPLGSGRIEARIGLRMMPTFPRSPLSFRTAGFPQYGWKAGFPSGAFLDAPHNPD